jgi:hypothetical protein
VCHDPNITRQEMRLTSDQAETIRSNIRLHLGMQSRIWLFGSRVDDQRRPEERPARRRLAHSRREPGANQAESRRKSGGKLV